MKILDQKYTQNNGVIQLVKSGLDEICEGLPLVIGVFHGDEPQGQFLIEQYLKYNNGANILFIPCLNPDGMLINQRTNSNGVDLNRNFPTKNWGLNEGKNATCDDSSTDYWGGKHPASEIETNFLIAIIEKYKPRSILTIHAPYKVVNYDGPAKELSEKISAIIGYPSVGSIGYPTPGSFGNWAGVERNYPTITLELDENIQVSEYLKPMFNIFEIL